MLTPVATEDAHRRFPDSQGAVMAGRNSSFRRTKPAEGPAPYRCAECGHGHNLTAWGQATVHGPLDAAGNITYFDWDEVWEVHDDSVQCSAHPSFTLEKNIGGQWHRWWRCPRCDGRQDLRCPEAGIVPADGSQAVHASWWPVSAPWPVLTLNRGGHVFTPGMEPQCRHCRVDADTPRGRDMDCKGDQHACPVRVPEGTSSTTWQAFGANRAEWYCFQPGVMTADFTQWLCESGHVITHSHVPAGQEHSKSDCPLAGWKCPWAYLASEGARR